MSTSSALSSLLGHAGAKRFVSEAWPDEQFVVHRRVSELPEFFQRGPLASFEELSQVYSGRVQIAGGRGDDHLQFSVSNAPPEHLRRIGLTVFFGDDVSPYAPGAAEFLRALEAELGAPSGIGAIRTFASPAKGGGLDAHYDQGETFIVQLAGRKEIRLTRNTSYPLLQFIPGKPPVDEHYPEFPGGFPDAAPAPDSIVTLKPGSVLFIPRGCWHRTESAGDDASFSASICIDTPSALDVLLDGLRAQLRRRLEWRRPLFAAWGSDRPAQLELLRGLVSDLAQQLPALSPESFVDVVGRVDPRSHPLRPASRFQRVPTSRFVSKKGKNLFIHTYGDAAVTEIALSDELRPVCRWVDQQRPAFTFEALCAAHPRVSIEFLEALVRSLVEADGLKWLAE